MQDDIIQKTSQSLALPLYALIHDSIAQALKTARVSRQVALAIVEQIPQLSVSPNEKSELENAQGLIQLEDSFGSGKFYIIGAGSNHAFICTDQKHADYLDQLMKSHSDQDFLPQDQSSNQQNSQQQNQSENENSKNQDQSKQQQNTNQEQDLLTKLQVIDWILKGNEQNKSTIKIGQSKQQNDKTMVQKLALIELMQGKDTTEIFKNLQMFQMLEDFSLSGSKQNPLQ